MDDYDAPTPPPTDPIVARQIDYLNRRQTALEERVPPLIEHAVRAAMTGQMLTEQERDWVRGAIRAQAERADLRHAVIEKTLAGLAWSVIAAVAYGAWEYVRIKLGIKE